MGSNPSPRLTGTGSPQLEFRLIVGFVVCFILCAVYFQLRTRTVPWLPGSPVEYFTSSMLWMLSLVCLLLSEGRCAERKNALFWLAACAALALLALDELFEIHEVTERRGWFDDDYLKVLLWAAAGWALNHVRRREATSAAVTGALIVGFVFQSLHILIETGDGFLFRFPHFLKTPLKWYEEFLELFFLSSYLVGFFVHLRDLEKGRPRWGLVSKTEAARRAGEIPSNRLPEEAPQTINGPLIGFIVVYVLCAVSFQLGSVIPPGTEGSAIDFFTSRVLWMLCLVCLLMALKKLPDQRTAFFWLVACAALALMAIDEVFAFHERSTKVVGDDDYIKVVSWLLAAGALYLIRLLEKPPPLLVRFLWVGYLFQTLWILVDVGDGDFYRLPLSRDFRLWAEECFELLALSTYLAGFVALYGNLCIRRFPSLKMKRRDHLIH